MFLKRIRAAVIIMLVVAALDLAAAQLTPLLLPGLAERIGLAPADDRPRTGPPFRPASFAYEPGFAGSISWGPFQLQPYFTNSLGFKDASTRTVPRVPEGRRILILGDSFTEGVGMPFERTFAGRLAGKLPAVDILNGGVQGFSPRTYLAKLRHLMDAADLRFGEVLVFIDVSDIPNESPSPACRDVRGDERHRPRLAPPNAAPARARVTAGPNTAATPARAAPPPAPPPPETLAWWHRFKTEIKTYSLAALFLDRLKDTVQARMAADVLGNVNWSLALWTIDDDLWAACAAAGVARATDHMSRMADLLRQRGKKLTAVIYPWPDQIFHEDQQSRHRAIWTAWAKEAGVPLIDLFPDFFAFGDPRQTITALYLAGDVHFSARGHAFVAEKLLPRVADGKPD